MNVKTMEGLVGARTNMSQINTPMRVFKEARRKGNTAAMERAMGYAGEFADKAKGYKAEAYRGMEEDAEEARERAESGQIKEDETMAMEISGNYKDYKNDYSESLQEGRDKVKQTGKQIGMGIGKEQGAGNESENTPVLRDEYISSEKSGHRPSGLYRLEQDENGNPKVLYDDPKKRGIADGNGQPKVKAEDPEDCPEDNAEECTGSTDKVDREIEKLKEKKRQLEQQVRAASGDEKRVKELEKKLSQVEGELSRKDNDTYRRQHSVFS